MAPPEAYKSEIGSRSTMCQVHTGAHYSRMEKPTIPLGAQERLPRIDYSTRSIYHYVYARQTQVNWRTETKKTKEDKGEERKEKEAKHIQQKIEKETKEKKRQEKQEKTKQEEEARRENSKVM